ncbi:MAG: hypothetical protein FJ197_12100, partial [Gammaproteobacteria bacterium]|nr:hypothetical protein [Gammaproteobacteria bacterium]
MYKNLSGAIDMAVWALGYVRIGAKSLDAWRKFAIDTVGFMGQACADGSLRLRTDDRPFRLR